MMKIERPGLKTESFWSTMEKSPMVLPILPIANQAISAYANCHWVLPLKKKRKNK